MRAVVITRPGPPEILRVEERNRRDPGPREIRVRIRSSGVNRADLLQRSGNYPAPPGWPHDIPGLEFSGTVEDRGPDAVRYRVGERVMGIVGGGGCAESIVTHEDATVPVPDGVGLLEAGAIPEVFMTAFDAVFRQADLRSGETLLIHAVGSGVGTAAVQLAQARGARTVGTSRTPEKLEKAGELGLDHGVEAGRDWPAEVLDLTHGSGADVILDLVGGPYLEGNQKVVATRGRHIVVGVPGGRSATLDLRTLMARRATVVGTVLRARPLEEKIELAREFEATVLPLFNSGRVKPVVDQALRPDEAPEAHRLLEANATFGKILLDWEA